MVTTLRCCAPFVLLSGLLAMPQDPTAGRPAAAAPDAARTAWPSFHGPNGSGVAEGFATPTRWDVAKGTNVAWKTALPGLSHSSPIVWGDRIFLLNAVRDGAAELKVGLYGSVASVPDEGEHEFQLVCIDRDTGKVRWTRTSWKGVPKIKRHPKGSHAASTPATDGRHVVAFYGSEGLYTYDFDGKLLWKKDLGVLDAGWFRSPKDQWGFASSPTIHDGKVFVQCDVQKGSFVACFDLATGEQVWRTGRDEICGWGTPTIDTGRQPPQVILNGFKHMGGYDLATGKELWKVSGGGDIPVPRPVVADGLVFLTNAHGRLSPILAVATSAEGEFTIDAGDSKHVVWSITRGGNYMQTPLVYKGLLYACRDHGVLSCFTARTGEQHYRKRLEAGMGYTASGVAADDKLYYPSETGEVFVVAAGKQFEILARNPLGATCMASPAISRGVLYFRTRSHLIAIAEQQRR